MSKVVIGSFHDRDSAESAIQELKNQGLGRDLSLVTRDDEGEPGVENRGVSYSDQNLAEGSITGGALGGIAGMLAGAGALLIPGIGPILAAGPLAASLTGIVTGGIAGGLVDYGIPEERSEFYEEQVRQGSILVSLKSSSEKVDAAADILREYGAEDVETHN